ncbi:MAG: NADH-quinone oxidoreductase subunit C, partial [Chloroflexi bacterium]|nr:NADH-quinone oxidoreductase subunit C [Chloroflexota bacterium]
MSPAVLQDPMRFSTASCSCTRRSSGTRSPARSENRLPMTKSLAGADVARRINAELPGSVVESHNGDVRIERASILNVARFLKDTEGLEFSFLSSITAVDYVEHFELVYHLTSLKFNQSIVLKANCYGRDELSAPSVSGVWRGAAFQEREIWVLFGKLY